MRANKKVSYVVHDVPPVPEEFEFIKERAQVENYEMYGNFNMGAGFAFILPEKHARQLIDIAKVLELKAWAAGTVEQASGDKEVVFTAPALAGLRFTGSDLGVR
jgi:phosphoribosylformylglycinamidine cyclo-ligase